MEALNNRECSRGYWTQNGLGSGRTPDGHVGWPTASPRLLCEVPTPVRAGRLDTRAEGTSGRIKITQKPGVELCGYCTFMATKRVFYFCVFRNYVQILFLSNLWSTSQKRKQAPCPLKCPLFSCFPHTGIGVSLLCENIPGKPLSC